MSVLNELNDILIVNQKSLKDFPQLPQFEEYPEVLNTLNENRLLVEELSYDSEDLISVLEKEILLTTEQRSITQTVNNDWGESFFLDGPGGTGKSFVIEQVLADVRSKGNVALAVASSGIAALLLTGGRTVHSRFRLPLQLDETTMCNISKQSNLAALIRESKIIIWDEAPMCHRYAFEAINRTLQDIMGNSMLFGGKTMLLSGDFRQILHVIPKASDTQIMKACISYSDLWQYFNILKLTKNMRVQQKGRTLDFPEFLLSIGNGTHKKNSLLDSDYFKMP